MTRYQFFAFGLLTTWRVQETIACWMEWYHLLAFISILPALRRCPPYVSLFQFLSRLLFIVGHDWGLPYTLLFIYHFWKLRLSTFGDMQSARYLTIRSSVLNTEGQTTRYDISLVRIHHIPIANAVIYYILLTFDLKRRLWCIKNKYSSF